MKIGLEVGDGTILFREILARSSELPLKPGCLVERPKIPLCNQDVLVPIEAQVCLYVHKEMDKIGIHKYFRRKEKTRERNGRDPKERDLGDTFGGS